MKYGKILFAQFYTYCLNLTDNSDLTVVYHVSENVKYRNTLKI